MRLRRGEAVIYNHCIKTGGFHWSEKQGVVERVGRRTVLIRLEDGSTVRSQPWRISRATDLCETQ